MNQAGIHSIEKKSKSMKFLGYLILICGGITLWLFLGPWIHKSNMFLKFENKHIVDSITQYRIDSSYFQGQVDALDGKIKIQKDTEWKWKTSSNTQNLGGIAHKLDSVFDTIENSADTDN